MESQMLQIRRNIWIILMAAFYVFLGSTTQSNAEENISIIKNAAEQGDATAQLNLGVHYDLGKGVPQNDQQAVDWYKKAAEQGNADAQLNLGARYDKGKGVQQNTIDA